MIKPLSLAAFAAAMLSACTPSYRPQPIDVTRYHLDQPFERTTVSIEPIAATDAGPEYQLYAGAVRGELERLGYVQSTSDMPSGYIAGVSFRRALAGSFREPPPFSIGLGGGSFGGGRHGGVGVGGGASFGIGGKTRQLYATELWVQLRRRSDNSTIWEGRAQTQTVAGTESGDPRATAARLAHALFKGFPGESGVTITVK